MDKLLHKDVELQYGSFYFYLLYNQMSKHDKPMTDVSV